MAQVRGRFEVEGRFPGTDDRGCGVKDQYRGLEGWVHESGDCCGVPGTCVNPPVSLPARPQVIGVTVLSGSERNADPFIEIQGRPYNDLFEAMDCKTDWKYDLLPRRMNWKRCVVLNLLPQTTESSRCWGLERTRIRRCTGNHDCEVKQNSEGSEGD